MTVRRILVIGAAGDVGRGVTAAASARGWSVAAAGRNPATLADAVAGHADAIATPGDLSSDATARALWDAAVSALGGIDAVVVSVNAPNNPRPLAQWSSSDLLGLYTDNVLTHATAARVFLPLLPSDGVFVGIGGGTADFLIPGLAPVSMAQAAQRMLYTALARETAGPAVRELMIFARVNGFSKVRGDGPGTIDAVEVGRRVCDIVAAPAEHAGPILKLVAPDVAQKAAAS